MRKHVFIPEAGREELVDLPVSRFLLRHSEPNALFDTGRHPDFGADPENRQAPPARAMTPSPGVGKDVTTRLSRLGRSPTDIDIVGNSRLHYGHCDCNGFFAEAIFFAHERESASAGDQARDGNGCFRADRDHSRPVETLAAGHGPFHDGRIALLPFPGHSPGLAEAMIGLDCDDGFLLTSDAVDLRKILGRGTVPRNSRDAELAVHSTDDTRRLDRAGATVMRGHDARPWAEVGKGLERYG